MFLESSIEDVCARVGLPSVDLVIFQSAVVERHTNPMESDVHLLPLRSGTVTVLLRESSLAVSTKENGVRPLSYNEIAFNKRFCFSIKMMRLNTIADLFTLI